MGIINKSNTLYLQVSCGKFKYKKDGKRETAGAYEGKLVKIEYDADNEFEGKKIPQYHVIMRDTSSDETAVITFGEDTYFYRGFFARITQVDLSQPFTIGVTNSKENEKISFCYLKQSGNIIKPKEDFPNPEKIKKGKLELLDWSNVNNEVSVIVEAIQEKLEEITQEDFPF